MSIEGADNKQSNFANELNNFDKGIKTLDKNSFLNNLGLLFSAREKVLNSFRSRLFPIKKLDKIPTQKPATEPEVAAEPTKARKATEAKTKRKISSLKLCEEFLNEIKYEGKTINEKIFRDYFLFQSRSYLTKVLYDSGKIKNDKIVKNINNGLIELRNSINSKEMPENENPKKVVNIVEKIINFNEKQKGKGLKILTPKKMFQRLPITLAQVKAGNTSENLLNKIRKIMFFISRKRSY